ncbi:MAG TPA: hypothetical protein VLA88_05905 [Candidatus Saccharimonadales bacterium]|nr:hypothetical protein [Candidatus Saccharimonadales bacterium]
MDILAEGASVGHMVDTTVTALQWMIIVGYVLFVLLLDRFVLNRKLHALSVKESGLQVALFMCLNLLFGVAFVLPEYSLNGLMQYYGLYVSENSLSVDNLFIMLIILKQCGVPRELHQKALYWGINIAILLRVSLILVGTAVLVKAAPAMLAVAGYMLYVGYSQIFSGDDEKDVTERWSYKLVNKFVPVTYRTYGSKFFIRQRGKRLATVLFVVVAIIGCVDAMFALDSIPTAIALSSIMFVTIAGNINGVLGLRPMYFLMGHMAKYITRLNWGLGLICGAIGVKLIISNTWFMPLIGQEPVHVPISVALAWIGGSLLFAYVAGRIWPSAAKEGLDDENSEDSTLVTLYVDSGAVAKGEWESGLMGVYASQALVEARHYDDDGQVPVHVFAEAIGDASTAQAGAAYELERPYGIGTRPLLAPVLQQARRTAESVLGTHVAIILTPGVFGDQEEVRRLMREMPDNLFLLFIRVSDEPGGAGFLGELDTLYTDDRDSCHVVYATDDHGRPKQLIAYEIGTELDHWLKRRDALLTPA